MKSLVLALALAAPAAAVEKVVLPVSPLVVGSIAQAGHPLIPRLDAYARTLLVAPDMGTHPRHGPVSLALTEWTGPNQPVADRISGYALARLIVEPGLVEHAVALNPALDGTAIASVPNVLYSGTAYRGGIARRLSEVYRIAGEANTSAPVAALFDGAAVKTSLDDAGVTSRALYVNGQKTTWLGFSHAGRIFAHPTEPGAVIELSDEALPADDRAHELPTEGERLRRALAVTGHAPRELGRDVVFSRGFGKTPMRKVVIREQVFGKNIASMGMEGEYTAEDKKLVREALLAYVAAGGALHDLKPGAVVIGTTLLRPEKRAYFMDASLLSVGPSPEVLGGVDAWLSKLDFDITVWKARAQRGFGSFRF